MVSPNFPVDRAFLTDIELSTANFQRLSDPGFEFICCKGCFNLASRWLHYCNEWNLHFQGKNQVRGHPTHL